MMVDGVFPPEILAVVRPLGLSGLTSREEGPLVAAGESREPAASGVTKRCHRLFGAWGCARELPLVQSSACGRPAQSLLSEFTQGVMGTADQLPRDRKARPVGSDALLVL
jgi:hypothetical protein